LTELLPRLLDTSDDDLELALLRSARDERPGPAGLHGTALALGLTTATAAALAESVAATQLAPQALGHAATQAATHGVAAAGSLGATGGGSALVSAGSASAATAAKYLLAGALLSFGTAATVNHALTPSDSKPHAPVSALQAPGKARLSPRVAPAPTGHVATPAVEPEPDSARDAPPPSAEQRRKPSLSLRHEPAPPAASRPGDAAVEASLGAAPSTSRSSGSFAPPTPTPPTNASLAAEIRWLDRTRAALAAGDTATARALLRAYTESGPSGVLSHEADLLRVQLLVAEGDRHSAAALARRIIAQSPRSNHVDSLRSLAAEP
jgi:hypothetical protein